MNVEEPLPCPFCGNEVKSQSFWWHGCAPGNGPRGYYVFCLECSETDALDGPRRDTFEDAIAAWNRRTPAPEGEVVTERLRKIMGHLKNLNTEHSRQRNCPSRGYDEDAALGEMTHLSSAIDAELDAIDALYASPVVPVGVSREDIARLLHAIVDSDGTIVRVEEAVDAILDLIQSEMEGSLIS